MSNDLEHGWLLGENKSYKEPEFVCYCEKCEKPIYEDDEYEKLHGAYFCGKCALEMFNEENDDLFNRGEL